MKTHYLVGIICFALIGLIFLYPWFEIFLCLLGLLFVWFYRHYWLDKSYYGPYIYYDPEGLTSMVVNWVGVSDEMKKTADNCWVEVCLDQNFHPELTTKTICQEATLEKERVYYHITLKNLEANKQYFYRIGLSNQIIFPDITSKLRRKQSLYHFKTPVSPSYDKYDDFKAIVYGDDQTADFVPVLAQRMNHLQYKENPNFIIHLGDINQNLWNLHENNAFFTTKRKLFRTIPYMPVIGNHDAKPLTQFTAFYTTPHWYSFSYGSKLRCVIISGHDSFIPGTHGQYEFIEQELQAAVDSNQYCIICVHEGPYNIEQKYEEERAVAENRKYIVPLLERFNQGLQTNLVMFSGHKHTYERVIENNMTYLTVGSCSNGKAYSKLENTSEKQHVPEAVEFEYGAQSYAVLTIENGHLLIKIKNIVNKVVERLDFTLN